jgi:hypothetical protein
MPYLICEKTKQKMTVNIEVCRHAKCPHIKYNPDIIEWDCGFKPIAQKRIEKRRKK